MSKLLDLSSIGMLSSPPFSFFPSPPRPVSSHIVAAVSDESSHPTEQHRNPALLSLWQLVTCVHPILSPPPSPVSFISHFPLIFSAVFFFLPHKRKEQADDLHASAYNSLAQLLIPRLFCPLSNISSCSLSSLLHLSLSVSFDPLVFPCPHCEAVLTLRL